MKILHLPYNIASFASESVKGLNKIKGVTARGIILGESVSKYDSNENMEIRHKVEGSSYNPVISFRKFVFFIKYLRDIISTDIVHWYWKSGFLENELDLRIIRFLRKPLVIEWVGSEIRNPEIEMKVNPFYKEVFYKGYEYAREESSVNSERLQKLFAKYNAVPILCRGASIYYHINKSYFSKVLFVQQRIDMSKYSAFYPDETNRIPLLIHSPTARICKGTEYVINAVNNLKSKFNFRFELIENMSREEVREKMQQCDIYIDQFILGGYGMAATEALALGKPVVCFLHEKNLEELPENCPIVNTDIYKLEQVLEKLIPDAKLRNSLGKQSREYAAKYHDSVEVAKNLHGIYKNLI